MKKKPFMYPVIRVLCVSFLKIFYPYEVENGFCLPEDKKMIVCGNHVSNIDPVLVDATQNRLLNYMAKSELFEFKPFAKLITSLGAFPVHRGSDGGKAIHAGAELLEDDNVVGIFVEGTRSKDGNLQRPHSGAIVLAYQTDTPILPVCITGENGIIKPFKKIKITYGAPVTCTELGVTHGTRDEYRKGAENLMKIIAEMRAKHREEFDSKKK